MTIHIIILAFTCLSSMIASYAYRFNKKALDNAYTISLLSAFISFSLLVYFVGMRTSFADTPAYIIWFNETDTNFSNLVDIYQKEHEGIGFVLLMKMFKRYISEDINAFFMFLAIFQGFTITKLYRKYSINYSFSVFLFMASTTYVWFMNGIRQFTAICVVLCFFDYILNRKFLRFLLIVLIAASIHSTAIIWIPMYFIIWFKPFSWRIWVCVVATLIVFFFINEFTTLLDSSLEGTVYEGTGEHLMNYTDEATGFTDDGVNILRVLVAAVPPAIALWRRKEIEAISDPMIDICINLSTASVGIYLLGMVTSGILVGRVPMYFMILNFILLPWLIEKAFVGRFRTIMKILCVLFYCAYFYYVMVVQGTARYESAILNIYQ